MVIEDGEDTIVDESSADWAIRIIVLLEPRALGR